MKCVLQPLLKINHNCLKCIGLREVFFGCWLVLCCYCCKTTSQSSVDTIAKPFGSDIKGMTCNLFIEHWNLAATWCHTCLNLKHHQLSWEKHFPLPPIACLFSGGSLCVFTGIVSSSLSCPGSGRVSHNCDFSLRVTVKPLSRYKRHVSVDLFGLFYRDFFLSCSWILWPYIRCNTSMNLTKRHVELLKMTLVSVENWWANRKDCDEKKWKLFSW